jgi:hypothetical protein
LVPPDPNGSARREENARINGRLTKLILDHRVPPNVSPAELRAIMVRTGYDLQFSSMIGLPPRAGACAHYRQSAPESGNPD